MPFVWLALASLLFVFSASAKERVYLYTYHNKPPFIVDLQKREGLYFDFAKLLNARNDKYNFITTYLPRKRLDHFILNDQLDGVVLGVSPIWFGDKQESKFLWLPTLYSDSDEFVSLKSTPFEYRGKDSLANKTVAGVAGYYYFGINEAVEAGSLKRIDTVGEREVLTLIEKARVDMGIVSQSVFKYLRKENILQGNFHFSARQHDKFERRAFTAKSNPHIYNEMKSLITLIQQDGSWSETISQYE